MFDASSDEVGAPADDPSTLGDEGPTIEGDSRGALELGRLQLLGRWLECNLWHGRAHRWFPRYLGGYGRCSACGRTWD